MEDDLSKGAFISFVLMIFSPVSRYQMSLIQIAMRKDTTCPSVRKMLVMGEGAAALTKALH